MGFKTINYSEVFKSRALLGSGGKCYLYLFLIVLVHILLRAVLKAEGSNLNNLFCLNFSYLAIIKRKDFNAE